MLAPEKQFETDPMVLALSQPVFTTQGDMLTKVDILRLPIENKPFRIVSLPDPLDDPHINSIETALLIIWFEGMTTRKSFELPACTVDALKKRNPTFQQRWMFHFDDELHVSIVPYQEQ